MPHPGVTRFLGGPPLSVAVKLILLCVLVGFVLHSLKLHPWDVWRWLSDLVVQIWNMGWDAVVSLGRYFVIGAIIVLPIWLLMRLAKSRNTGRTP
jgi:hypothetical protein